MRNSFTRDFTFEDHKIKGKYFQNKNLSFFLIYNNYKDHNVFSENNFINKLFFLIKKFYPDFITNLAQVYIYDQGLSNSAYRGLTIVSKEHPENKNVRNMIEYGAENDDIFVRIEDNILNSQIERIVKKEFMDITGCSEEDLKF